MIVNDLVSA